MKPLIFSLFLTAVLSSGIAQDLNYSVHGKYANPITREKLENARSMSDIIPYYPSSWIDSYKSVEMILISDGNQVSTASADDILSDEQIKMLHAMDYGDEIVINIGYQYKNNLTNQVENGAMHYSTTLVPETEAQYSGGNEQLSNYIQRNALDKITGEASQELEYTVVRFVVSEKGEISKAAISKTSGNSVIDNLLLEVVKAMPPWQPASDDLGGKVNQEFELSVWYGSDGC